MAYFPNDIITSVTDVARIHYVNRVETKAWNEHRREGELRLLTGWSWTARDGSDHRQGFKTASACIRDAYYVLMEGRQAPGRRRLRVVRGAAA